MGKYISSIIYRKKNREKLYTLYTQSLGSLENTELEGCVGFSTNYTQLYTKSDFKKFFKKFQKKYCKVVYNVILFICKEQRKHKRKGD